MSGALGATWSAETLLRGAQLLGDQLDQLAARLSPAAGLDTELLRELQASWISDDDPAV